MYISDLKEKVDSNPFRRAARVNAPQFDTSYGLQEQWSLGLLMYKPFHIYVVEYRPGGIPTIRTFAFYADGSPIWLEGYY